MKVNPDSIYLKEVSTEHGPCPWDTIELKDGTVLIISEEGVSLFASMDDYNIGNEAIDTLWR